MVPGFDSSRLIVGSETDEAASGLLKSANQQNDLAPFRFSALIFMAAFGTLACSFWP
jgi:hypothetical protein